MKFVFEKKHPSHLFLACRKIWVSVALIEFVRWEYGFCRGFNEKHGAGEGSASDMSYDHRTCPMILGHVL